MEPQRLVASASRLLTSLTLRPELATRYVEQRTALQERYDVFVSLRRARITSRRERAALDREMERARLGLARLVESTRLLLSANDGLSRAHRAA
jgi:hypothetical protein